MSEETEREPAPEDRSNAPDVSLTGTGGSEAEREAARRLTRQLRDRGLAVISEPAYFRPAIGLNRSLHALLAVAGGLVALEIPLLGAFLCLVAAFSWYADRALVTPLLGRLLPRRPTQNVLSPPPGPAWEEVRLIVGAGYDLDYPSPFSSWLSRRLTGLVTVDRLTMWAGMLPVFLSAMLRVAEFGGTAVGVLQLAGSAVLLGVVASEVDRRLNGSRNAADSDMAPASGLLEVLDSLDPAMVESNEVAVAFFGAEHSAAAGAREFFRRLSFPTEKAPKVLGLVGAGDGRQEIEPAVTAREGDLAVSRMSPVEDTGGAGSPPAAILRRESAASMARRRGLEAVSVTGSREGLVAGALAVIEVLSREEPEDE